MPFHIDTDGTRRRYSFQVQQGFGGNSGGGDGGNNTGSSVVSMPVVTGPTVTGIDSTVTLTATATSLLAGSSVSSFVWTKPNGTTEVKAAVSGSSSISFTARGADGDTLITTVYARDNAGNKSQVTSHVVTLNLIDVTNMTTNIPSTIAAGESVGQLSITGAMDSDGGSVTYGLTLPAGVTASKTTGLTNGELFYITAAANATVNPTANVTITVTASGGSTTQVVRRLAVTAARPAPSSVDEVFAVRLFNADGPASITKIDSGVDILNNAGIIWTKARRQPAGSSPVYGKPIIHFRGPTQAVGSTTLSGCIDGNTSNDWYSPSNPIVVSNDGFTVNPASSAPVIYDNNDYVTYSFRRAAKFLDVVTFTVPVEGQSVVVPHSLQCEVGAIIVFKTGSSSDNTSGKLYWHRSKPKSTMRLDDATINENQYLISSTTDTTFTTHQGGSLSHVGTYTAMVFAHDPSPTGYIQCGMTNGNPTSTVELSWKPQFLMTFGATGNGGIAATILDDRRRWIGSGDSLRWAFNTYADDAPAAVGNTTATGFTTTSPNAVYIAIRGGGYTPPDNGKTHTLTGNGTLVVPSGVTNLIITGNGSGGTAEVPGNWTGMVSGSPSGGTYPFFAMRYWYANGTVYYDGGYSGGGDITGSRSYPYTPPQPYSFVVNELAKNGHNGTVSLTFSGSGGTPPAPGTATTFSIPGNGQVTFDGASSGNTTPPAATVQNKAIPGTSELVCTYNVPVGGSLEVKWLPWVESASHELTGSGTLTIPAGVSSFTATGYAGVATAFTVNGSATVTYPGAGSGNGSTPVKETRVVTLSGAKATTIQYAVPSGGYLKIEW